MPRVSPPQEHLGRSARIPNRPNTTTRQPRLGDRCLREVLPLSLSTLLGRRFPTRFSRRFERALLLLEWTWECWSRRQDSNPRPAVYKTAALPLSYAGDISHGEGGLTSPTPLDPSKAGSHSHECPPLGGWSQGFITRRYVPVGAATRRDERGGSDEDGMKRAGATRLRRL
jgi:hypothetical protein